MIKVLLLVGSLAGASFANAQDDLRILTSADMYTLAQKLEKALRKCKTVQHRSKVSVEIRNETDELIDKPRFAGLIQSMMEGKTPARPETQIPNYELYATLSADKQIIRQVKRSTYRLSGELEQADEVLCRKTVKITKRSKLSPELN